MFLVAIKFTQQILPEHSLCITILVLSADADAGVLGLEFCTFWVFAFYDSA